MMLEKFFSNLGLPFEFKGEATASWKKNIQENIFDSKVFPVGSNKVETVGIINKKTFVITNEGNGKVKFRELLTSDEKLKKIKKLFEEGRLSSDEYNSYKRKILDEMTD